MLRYTKKGIESKERIGTLPLRMSNLLRYRGVNTRRRQSASCIRA